MEASCTAYVVVNVCRSDIKPRVRVRVIRVRVTVRVRVRVRSIGTVHESAAHWNKLRIE